MLEARTRGRGKGERSEVKGGNERKMMRKCRFYKGKNCSSARVLYQGLWAGLCNPNHRKPDFLGHVC